MSKGLGAGPATVVLVSGSGTNLQAIIDQVQQGHLRVRLVAVLSDVPDAYGLQRAQAAGIPTVTVNYKAYPDRPSAERALAAELAAIDPAIVVLAGFMRILPDAIVQAYQGRMLNVHPSLLPRFRGLHTYERVLEAGDAWHGTTVHFVVPELDAGPAIIQYRVAVKPTEDIASLRERVQRGEYLVYPQAIGWLASGRLTLRDGQAWLDDNPLAAPVQVDEAH
ncbi:MAG: phosphoribosylglycinamide formyltransferase [Chromatiales bacterium]|nr:MAG: phosphoribosylglycinamide formyltransferase [Chromatiales bacterium]